MIALAIADDHRMFVDAIKEGLSVIPDLVVVAVAESTDELMAALDQQAVDVILTDLEMPGGGGRAVIEHSGSVPVIVVSMFVDADVSRELLDAGAAGVLSKSVPLSDLAAAVRAVSTGEGLPMQSEELDVLLEEHRQPLLDPGAQSLTQRERELLDLLARGVSSTEELADRLYISQKTVKNHLASIFSKLSVADRTQAAIEAVRLGLGRPK